MKTFTAKITIICITIFFSTFGVSFGVSQAGTVGFSDHFGSVSSFESNWLRPYGDFTYEGRSGDAYNYLKAVSSSGSAEDPAIAVANNSQTYDNSATQIDATFKLTNNSKSAGVFFLMNPENFNGYIAGINHMEATGFAPAYFMLFISDPHEPKNQLPRYNTPIDLSYDTFYKLTVLYDDNDSLMSAFLYNATGSTLLGSLAGDNIDMYLPGIISGKTGIWADNATFDSFAVNGSPVPVPGAVWLFGSGIIGLLGLRKKLKR